MGFYKVTIKETLRKDIFIKADNEAEALDIIRDKYDDKKISLDIDNYDGTTHLYSSKVSLKNFCDAETDEKYDNEKKLTKGEVRKLCQKNMK